jgi:hypothetical protein
MTNLDGVTAIVSQLKTERTNLANQLRHVDAALSVLGKLDGGSNHTNRSQPTRIISAASRRKMAAAQKARWARVGKGPQPGAAKTNGAAPQHTISAAGRRKIAAAQRARWAKLKAAKKGA